MGKEQARPQIRNAAFLPMHECRGFTRRCGDAYEMGVRRHPNSYDEPTRKLLASQAAIGYKQQAMQLPEIKEDRPEYKEIHSQVLQDTLGLLREAPWL